MDFEEQLNKLLSGMNNQKPLDLNMLTSYLQGNQSRAAGQAGRGAGAAAMAGGYDPRAWMQHAQSNVYNDYANQFAQLPGEADRSQLGHNQSMMSALQLLFQNNQSKFNFWRDAFPGLLGAAGHVAGAYAGKP